MFHKKFALMSMLVFVGVAAGVEARAAKNVCQDQVNTYVREQLGWTEFTTEFVFGEKGKPTLVGVKRPGCRFDEYIIRMRASSSTCSNVHYGQVPNYIRGGYWTDRCNN